jgi:hypothetical protein
MRMRGRSAAEAQALGQLCGNLVIVATAAYVVLSTVVAFGGGTIPLTHLHIDGGVGFGLLWMFVVDPLLVSLALVAAYLLVTVLTFLLRLVRRPPAIDLEALAQVDRLELDLEHEPHRGPAVRRLHSTSAPERA